MLRKYINKCFDKYPILVRFRSKIVYAKSFAQRIMSYASIIQTLGIAFLVLAKLQEFGWNFSIKIWFIPIVIVLLLIMIIGGWIEDLVGMWSEEQKISYDRSPQIIEILEKVRKIDKKI